MKFRPLLLALAAFALAGCDAPAPQPLAKAAVQYATVKVASNSPEHAARIVEIVSEVRKVLQGETVTSAAALRQFVDMQIRWDRLKPEDRVLVIALLDAVEARLAEAIGDGVLPPDKALVVDQVLGWVVQAARTE